jgi:DNA topoisomerase VI subunit A
MFNDFDFGGLNIFTTAKNYSISSAHLPNLNIPNLELMGVRAGDIDAYFSKYPEVVEKAKQYDITNAKKIIKLLDEGKKQQFAEVREDLEYLAKEQKLLESPAFTRIGLDAEAKYVSEKLKAMGITK